MKPQEPRGQILASYQATEAKYADAHPDGLVFGDSRAAMWPEAQASGALGASSLCNMGDIGSVVEDALWRAMHTRIDLSHVTNCVIEIGINNINHFGHTESAAFIANGIAQLVAILAEKCAPGCHFYVMEPFEETPRQEGTEKERHALTKALASHAAAGDYDYVKTAPMDPTDTTYFHPGGLHLNANGYATYMTPALTKAVDATHPGDGALLGGDQGHMAALGHDTPFVESLLDQPLSHHFDLSDGFDLQPWADPFMV